LFDLSVGQPVSNNPTIKQSNNFNNLGNVLS